MLIFAIADISWSESWEQSWSETVSFYTGESTKGAPSDLTTAGAPSSVLNAGQEAAGGEADLRGERHIVETSPAGSSGFLFRAYKALERGPAKCFFELASERFLNRLV